MAEGPSRQTAIAEVHVGGDRAGPAGDATPEAREWQRIAEEMSPRKIKVLGKDYRGYSWLVDMKEQRLHTKQHRIFDVVVIVRADDFRTLSTRAHCDVWTADHYVTDYSVYPTARDDLPLPLRNRVREGDRAYWLRINRDYVPHTRVSFIEIIRSLHRSCTSEEYWLQLGDVVKLRQAPDPSVQQDEVDHGDGRDE
jgi:hypothetical protein